MPLPPKRWEDGSDSKFDAIRTKPWFQRLLKRKWQIVGLDSAHKLLLGDLSLTQKQVCEDMGLDPRELRDYIKFKHNINPEITAIAQEIINKAYIRYQNMRGDMSFHSCIEMEAEIDARPPRPYRELWEVCPDYYPDFTQ